MSAAEVEQARLARREARRRPWDEQVAAINERWPSTAWGRDQWYDALGENDQGEYDLMGRILRDVLRVGYEEPTRRGQRGPLEWDEGNVRLRALRAQRDGRVTLEAFSVAFADLAALHSRTQIARKTGLSRTQVHRLLAGDIPPTPTEIEQVAAAYGKPPVYFLEYRHHLILKTLANRLAAAPETAVDIVQRLEASN